MYQLDTRGAQVHPLIIRDPRTGRRSMLYFPAFFYRFVGAPLLASSACAT